MVLIIIKIYEKITSDYIVGFIDGEGCFTLHIHKRANSSFNICVTPSFSASQNSTSVHVLEEIQDFFGCGFIRQDRKTSKYEVRDLKNLRLKILPFFQKNKLRTQKQQDFLLFCEICDLLIKKTHLTQSGIFKLIDLAYSMNQSGASRRKKKSHLLYEIEAYCAAKPEFCKVKATK